jgi:hypothetical protein
MLDVQGVLAVSQPVMRLGKETTEAKDVATSVAEAMYVAEARKWIWTGKERNIVMRRWMRSKMRYNMYSCDRAGGAAVAAAVEAVGEAADMVVVAAAPAVPAVAGMRNVCCGMGGRWYRRPGRGGQRRAGWGRCVWWMAGRRRAMERVMEQWMVVA